MAAATNNPNKGNIPNYTVDSMSDNMMIRIDQDGSVWAKVSRPQPFKRNQSLIGTVYINGQKYTTNSQVFTQILPG